MTATALDTAPAVALVYELGWRSGDLTAAEACDQVGHVISDRLCAIARSTWSNHVTTAAAAFNIPTSELWDTLWNNTAGDRAVVAACGPVQYAHAAVGDDRDVVQLAAAQRFELEADELDVLARSENQAIRETVATHPRCDSDTLAVLAGVGHDDTVTCVALHPNTSRAALEHIVATNTMDAHDIAQDRLNSDGAQ